MATCSLFIIVLFITILSIIAPLNTVGYPTGAPELACQYQLPHHDSNPDSNTQPQPGTNGYTLTFPSSGGGPINYTTPEPLAITLMGDSASFKGFMISVFSTRTGNRIGSISYNDTTNIQDVCTTYCSHCAITHTNANSKTRVSFIWLPPEEYGSGSVTVNVTIVVTQPTVYRFSYLIPEVKGTTPPGTMAVPMVLDVTAPSASNMTNVTIGWLKPTNGSNPILEYLLFIRDISPIASSFDIIWSGLAYSTVITNLQVGTVYEIMIQANNTYVSAPSPALQIAPIGPGAALPPTPSSPAASTTIVPTLTTITLTWTDSGSGSASVQFIGYVLEMKRSSAPDTSYTQVYFGLAPSATVKGLIGATSYSFRLKSKSFAGVSPYSSSVTVSTYGSNCNSVGAFTPQGTCRCLAGYLGLQCEHVSPFVGGSQPCFGDHGYCLDWIVVQGVIYGRIQGQTNPAAELTKGWIGFGLGADDGMTGGHMMVFTVMEQDTAKLYNMMATGFEAPSVINTILPPSNYSGFYNDSYLDISFVRALNTGVAGDFLIPSTAGSIVSASWAMSSSFFVQHLPTNRGRLRIDFVGGVVNDLSSSEQVSYGFYTPFLLSLLLMVLGGLVIYHSKTVMRSEFGIWLLRKRPNTLFATSLKESGGGDSSTETGAITLPSTHSQKGFYEYLLEFLDTMTLDIRKTFIDWTWGELICFCTYCLGLLIAIGVGYSTYNPSARYRSHYIFGHLVAVQFSLLFLPVTRNSIWLSIFGISFERALKFHRIMARIMIVFVVIHLLTMEHMYGTSIFTSSARTPYGYGSCFGLWAFIFMCAMVLFAFEPIRRKAWELFIYTHLLLFPFVILFACLHNYQVRYYLIVPLLLYLLDRSIRFFYARRQVDIVSIKVVEGSANNYSGRGSSSNPRLVRLELSLPSAQFWSKGGSSGFQYKPGDYCFLNIPAVDYFAWHPFSISSSPYSVSQETMTFHILDMGANTFTHRLTDWLYDHFNNQTLGFGDHAVEMREEFGSVGGAHDKPVIRPLQSNRTVAQLNTKFSIQFPVHIDGPYGNLTVPLEDYSTIVLVAGGIGITPLYSILASLLLKQNTSVNGNTVRTIHLIWVNRSPYSFTEWFPELIGTFYPMFFQTLKLHFYYTGPGEVVGSAPVSEVLASAAASRRNTTTSRRGTSSGAVSNQQHPSSIPLQVRPNQSIPRAIATDASATSNSIAPPSAPASPGANTKNKRHSFVEPTATALVTSVDPEVMTPNPARAHLDSIAPPPPPPSTSPVPPSALGVDFDDDEIVPGPPSTAPPPPPPTPPTIPPPDEEEESKSPEQIAHQPLHTSAAAQAASRLAASLQVDLTGSSSSSSATPPHPPKIDIHTGRPNLSTLFGQIAQLHHSLDSSVDSPQPDDHALGGHSPNPHSSSGTSFHSPPQSRHIAIYACGPPSLVEDAQHHAMLRSWHMHKESFTL